MQPDSLVDRLATVPLFASVPRQELEWLAANGEMRVLEAGSTLAEVGTRIEDMSVLFEGRLSVYLGNRSAARKLMEYGPGEIVGRLPYSRFYNTFGFATIDETVTAFALHERHFPVMTRECNGLTTVLVHFMLDRAREFRSVQLNDDRLESLSRLASGFAHELNNPASAASRTAQALVKVLDQEEQAARELAAARLTDGQLSAVDAVRIECGRQGRAWSALESADREDDIAEWLARHGVDRELAEPLAASDVTMGALEQLAAALPPADLKAATRWIASRCAARTASRQIETATGRIHHLVGAMKGFTFMDREGVPEQVDVTRGLADTLAMLEGKARAKSATVLLESAPDLARVSGFGSQINQVWEKLVDNALDAVAEKGNVTITATTRDNSILVRIADDGPGIPEDIRPRIFDPFFTTKAVGHAGLGLDIARRMVRLNGGEIEFTSQPGRTVFKVRLPVAGAVRGGG